MTSTTLKLSKYEEKCDVFVAATMQARDYLSSFLFHFSLD